MGVRFVVPKVDRMRICAALDQFTEDGPLVIPHPANPTTMVVVDYQHLDDEDAMYRAAQARNVLDLTRY